MKLRGLFSALAAGAGLALIASTGTAQAYSPDPEVYNLLQYTDNCPCTHHDDVDGTYFQKDVGGAGLRSLVYHDGKLVGKVEFHPYGEKLWIYDTANDGDTFYVDVWVQRTPASKGVELVGTYAPPGTSDEVDYRVLDLDIPEGNYIELWFSDEADSSSFGESKRGFA
ncbi:hypothetical protein ABZ621_33380 [Streptomyces sp. NPDC007863]|uniref:hypothetical protein n=1 Tax=Streptomyces sp. NPDC007863 TaxID=3154894 RepID=UPI003410D609